MLTKEKKINALFDDEHQILQAILSYYVNYNIISYKNL